MTISTLLTAGALLFLAVAHSALGESDILRPLFAADWTMERTPRWATELILRFAWHLTSIAWIALALIVLEVAILPTVGAMMILSAAVIFVLLRGHLAWPIFLLGGLAAFHAHDPLPSTVLLTGGIVVAATLVAAAGIHVYWALGGRRWLDTALPVDPDATSQFSPGPVLTLLVAMLLIVGAGVVGWVTVGAPTIVRLMAMGAVGVFTVRAIGDTKAAGFTKTIRNTAFATADDRIFTPMCVLLALGTSGALLL